MVNSKFNIDELIISYLAGETTENENQTLNLWLNESAENLSYFKSIRNVWLASSQSIPSLQIDQVQNLNQILTKSSPKRFDGFDLKILKELLKIAALVVIIFGTGTVVLRSFMINDKSIINNPTNVEATIGSRALTTLPDGTKVWLNSGSKLEYDGSYNGEKREVKLLGEAYFSVVTNPSKPFIVKAGKLSIKALGTKFNVKAYPDEKSIITTLVKGKVIIEGKDNHNKEFVVQMKPKETVTFFNEGKTKDIFENKLNKTNPDDTQYTDEKIEIPGIPVVVSEHVNTELFTSWKDTRWIIEKQKLGDLARDLERRYNTKIHFLSDSIKQFHFSGTLENETIEQIMLIMRHTIPLKYKIEKGAIEVGIDPYLLKKFYN